MTDQPTTWLEAKASAYEAAVRDIAGDLVRLRDREWYFESEGDELALTQVRDTIGLLKERASTFADRARGLRAAAADTDASVLPMSATTRRRR